MPHRSLEKPIQFRYTEIQEFPSTLNESQRVNWMTRLFITEARKNLTAELIPGNLPALHTNEELLHLEGKLREHESWLAERVEKQKSVRPDEDPVIHTEEMRTRAKALEKELLKLMRRKSPPKKKGESSSSIPTGSAAGDSTSSETSTATQQSQETPIDDKKHDEL